MQRTTIHSGLQRDSGTSFLLFMQHPVSLAPGGNGYTAEVPDPRRGWNQNPVGTQPRSPLPINSHRGNEPPLYCIPMDLNSRSQFYMSRQSAPWQLSRHLEYRCEQPGSSPRDDGCKPLTKRLDPKDHSQGYSLRFHGPSHWTGSAAAVTSQ